MHLKNLEIRGFKSFADKTDLSFGSGITAVVGPNGSGKSNISDAVRWVLGEQSVKQLRGGKMEDVIFAGTQFRKPLGQASVSLTLDNSCQSLPVPYNEVTVTRRLYRSGESEYLLNNQAVRLRDIHELFMDTGIGREGYSIIGQGKIDAILSGKPEERRGLVEEAAGITKFKTRKEEGERKLRAAEENLIRVEDILSTYEERLGPLRTEKKKAEEFLVFSKELRTLQTSLILSDLSELLEKQEALEHQRQGLAGASSEKEAQRIALDDALEEEKNRLDTLGKEKASKKEAFYRHQSEKEAASAQRALDEEKIRTHEEGAEKAQAILTVLEEEAGRAVVQRKQEEEALAILEQRLLVQTADLAAAAESVSEIEGDIQAAEAENQAAKDQEAALQEAYKDAQQALQQAQSRKEYLLAREESLSNLDEGYETTLRLNEEGAASLEAQRRVLEEKDLADREILEKEEEALASLDASRKHTARRMDELKSELREGASKQTMLQQLEQSHEGYQKSVRDLFRFLKTSRSPLEKDTHLIGDVLQAKPEHALAIEAALGGYVGNVITKTDEEAKALIALLKKHRLGRCTFLPQNIIKARRIPMPQLKTVQALGFASDLVETAPAFREIIDSILARTLVLRTMDEAVLAARETGYRIKIVTLEGDIIAPGGAMTGGSQKGGSAGVVSRRAQIESLGEQLRAARATLAGEQIALEGLREALARQTDVVRALREKRRAAELEAARLSERIEGFRREVRRMEEVLQDQTSTKEAVQTQLAAATEAAQEAKASLSRIEEKQEQALTEREHLREERKMLFAQSDALRDALANQRLSLQKVQGEKEQMDAALLRLSQREEENALRKSQALEQLHSHRTSAQELVCSLGEKTAAMEEHQQAMAALDQAYDALDMQEVSLKARLKERENHLETLRSEADFLSKELYKVQLMLERAKEEEEELLRRLNEDLNLTLAEAKDEAIPLESKAKARRRMGELKSAITSLGRVNLSSLEEYEKVSTHYEFLQGQRNDLLSARAELLNLIAEVTKKMRTLFRENFVILSRNFRETFRQLFNGGTGELLLGEGDELTGAIDINVQPPGKKLQNINLLSGGEKVLSAIALTFAILRMKPSPFCFLDEIEAALDDANVYRYASFLKEFAQETQFILITHRKGTMEAANVLYGVTMEERGISKIVSVDLDHFKEDAP
ncbi:Chromosome partition protein smc [Clostridiaceae bacterium JG1575]|nr:Chromosome partition protein smc [Clostridiaceae bacterium JG1575]